MGTSKSSLNKTGLSQETNSSDNIISGINEKAFNKPESFTKKKD